MGAKIYISFYIKIVIIITASYKAVNIKRLILRINMIITGSYIRQMRESIGLSQQELATLAKISQAHVAKIENSKVDPRLSTVNGIMAILESRGKTRKCRNFMKVPVIVQVATPVKEVINIMKSKGISQLPVMKGDMLLGSIMESTILEKVHHDISVIKAGDIMERPFPVLDGEENIQTAKALLDFSSAVLVSKKGMITGILTKADLIGVD
jgi:predicted transcriptional regulator